MRKHLFLISLSILLPFHYAKAAGIGDLVINEIQVSNVDRFVDGSWNYGSWIEFYNPTGIPRQLRGCWLSDDPNDLKKVRITQNAIVYGHKYKNLWFEHHDKYYPGQINMELEVEGGTIYLSDANGNLIMSQAYPPAVPRASWARKSDAAEEWGYTDTPTPAASNGEQLLCAERMEAPVVSNQGCIFTQPFVVHVDIPENATLRYTTDGSTPSWENGTDSENGEFNISKTVVYRFALMRKGWLTSPVITCSYIKKDKQFTLPVISVVSSQKNLYSNEMGIFTQGINGRPGLGQSAPCNWNMDWDRPANFEYMSPEGLTLVNQEVDINRSGGWSRAWIPYSFKIHAKKKYEGINTLDYPFFKNKPYNKNKVLLIRNGGNDNSCRVKDPFIQQLVVSSGMDMDAQAYQPVAHYINGRYMGVINMREPNNRFFVYANYGFDEDEIDLFGIDPDTGYVQKCGTREAFERWYALSSTSSDEESYKAMKSLVDIDEFCNYMALELYLGVWDWPSNNLKCWRPASENGRFRFIVYDLDSAFDINTPFTRFESKRINTFNTLYGEDVTAWVKEIEIVTIFLNMLENDSFRKQFIDTFCLMAGAVFEPSRCRELITEWTEYVYPMKILDDEGYGCNASPWTTANTLIEKFQGWAPEMYRQLISFPKMKLNGKQTQKVKFSANIPQATIRLNGLDVPTARFDGKLFSPVTLKAEAPSGYVFDGWLQTDVKTDGMSAIIPKGSKWTYYDKGSMDGKNWKKLGAGSSGWKTGKAPLGYGNASTGYATVMDYGGDANNKRPTYYFRKNVTLEETPGENGVFQLAYLADDGFVVYVNEVEVARYNMPEGNVSYSTFASSYASTNPDEGVISINSSYFHKGVNCVAVELHNNSATSSDVYWDASLSFVDVNEFYVSKEPEMTLPDEDITLAAHFSKVCQSNTFCPILINEVSAANSVHVNEYYKKGDWVELYNQTDNELDLDGMYLSDDLEEPHKYQISSGEEGVSTIIPANGFRVIWCDKQKSQSQLHAPFKLKNADKSLVVLSSEDGEWADTLVYCVHDGTESVGRYPNGSNQLYHFSSPTIGKPNRMNMQSVKLDKQKQADPNVHVENVHLGDMALKYSHDQLVVRSESETDLHLIICSVDGKIAMDTSIVIEGGRATIPVSLLRKGTYVANLTDASGEKCTIKFVVHDR